MEIEILREICTETIKRLQFGGRKKEKRRRNKYIL